MARNAKNNGIPPCANLSDLAGCLATPAHAVPTVEFTVYNMELPLSQEDYDFFSAAEINVFAQTAIANAANVRGAPARATSQNLTDMTLTFDVPFVLMGICVYAYAEPVDTVVEGNSFWGTRANIMAAANPPVSPVTAWHNAVAHAQLWNAAVPAGSTMDTMAPASLNWGGPAWRLIWAFMHAYRLEMKCPTSGYEILMNEALADIGNCCGQVEWGGFGNSNMDYMKYVNRTNDRMAGMTWPILNAAGANIAADPGVFYPHNGVQNFTAAVTYNTYGQRQLSQPVAYGRPISLPTVEQWYRLPCPIPFPSIPQPKLKITLRQAVGDETYFQRLITEGLVAHTRPITGATSDHPMYTLAAGGTSEGYADAISIPGGQLRIGLGLKGFEVRESVCEHLSDLLASSGMQNTLSQLSGIVSGPSDRVSMPVGSMGNPDAR